MFLWENYSSADSSSTRGGQSVAQTCRFVLHPAGVLQLLTDVVNSSPNVTTQQLDWNGKPTGFALAPTAAPFCRASTTGLQSLNSTSAAATAATFKAIAEAPLIGQGSAHSPAPASEQTIQSAADMTGPLLAGKQVALNGSLSPAWHAPRVDKTYSRFLQAWGLREPTKTLEAVLLLLLALCQAGSWSAAAVLYAADVSSTLEQLCGFADAGTLALTGCIYR